MRPMSLFKFNTVIWLTLSLVISLPLAVLYPGVGVSEFILAIMSMSTFLFGLLIAFSISDRHQRLKQVQEHLRSGDSNVTEIYELSLLFGKATQKKMGELLDNWLMTSTDYYLEDYRSSYPSAKIILNYILTLKPNRVKKQKAFEKMVDAFSNIRNEYSQLPYLISDRLSKLEWYSLNALALVILFCMYYMNSGSIVSVLIIVPMTMTLIAILLILRDLNNLAWKTNDWLWTPLQEIYLSIDKIPYLPEVVIKKRQAILRKGFKYRSVTYPDAYPNFKNKKVVIRTYQG
jgi:hypothetical protein